MEYCKQGHERNDANTGKTKSGKRYCRVCNKLRMRRANSTPEAKAKNVARVRAYVKAHRNEYRAYCRDRRKKTSDWLKQQKSGGCSLCGETAVPCLDFHHRDPKQKQFSIGVHSSVISRKRLEEEVAKCDVICCNCHRKLHAKERTFDS